MNFEELKQKARARGANWIAIDSTPSDMDEFVAFGYEYEPIRNDRYWMPGIAGSGVIRIGNYTGSINWKESKREL